MTLKSARAINKHKLKKRVKQLELQLKAKEDAGEIEDLKIRLADAHANDLHSANKIEELTEALEQAHLNLGPSWMPQLLKENRPYKQTPYPDEYVEFAMRQMAEGNTPASKMPQLMASHFTAWTNQSSSAADKYDWGDEATFVRWRQTISFLVLAQCGRKLTAAAKQKNWTLLQDGSPIKGVHAEAFVVQAADVDIYLLPWYQYSKASAVGAKGSDAMMRAAQIAYSKWYDACPASARDGMPDPLPLSSLMASVANVNSDNAPNETLREDFQELLAGRKFNRAKCLHHNIMLMAKALRKTDGAALIDFLGIERDTKTKEFATSNIGDSLQVCNFSIRFLHTSIRVQTLIHTLARP